MADSVLDASAFLAYLQGEEGEDVVSRSIANGAAMSTVNLAEAFSRVEYLGADSAALGSNLTDSGLLHGAIWIEELTYEDSLEVARLRPLTRTLGLSLGDRSCLALAKRLGLQAVTADSAWAELEIDVEIQLIR